VYEFFAFDTLFACLVGAFTVATFFVATCRHSLDRFSRRGLFQRIPKEIRDDGERFIGLKDEVEGTLERLDIALRCALVFSCCVGRAVWLDGHLASGAVGEVGVEVGVTRLTELPAGALTALASILIVEILALTFIVLEWLPLVIGRLWPEPWLARSHRTIVWLYRLFTPVRWLLSRSVDSLSRRFGRSSAVSDADLFEEEILEKVEEAGREGLLEGQEGDMIESIFEFGDVQVSEVMTPRTEMFCLDLDDPLQKNLEMAIDSGYSRIPVYLEHKDNIKGVLYVKDLLKRLYSNEEIVLDSLVRQPLFVPTTKKIDELLSEFKQHRLQIAIVLDEYGGTDGLVSIEDVLEEIVGEITDEYEKEEAEPIALSPGGVADVDAAIHIDELNEELSLSIPESDKYDTIGGFLFASMGRIPVVGDSFDLEGGVSFEVTSADERRVLRLRIHRPEELADKVATASDHDGSGRDGSGRDGSGRDGSGRDGSGRGGSGRGGSGHSNKTQPAEEDQGAVDGSVGGPGRPDRGEALAGKE